MAVPCMSEATDILKATALELGFERVGVTPACRPKTFDAFRRWVDGGCHAGMNYLAERPETREHPRSVLPDVRSLLMLAVSYRAVLGEQKHPVRQLSGIAAYARGVDYHDWIRDRLRRLAEQHRKLFPRGRCRGAVDTVPVLERQFAVDAGLGTIGKNTMLIDARPDSPFGSRCFLAVLLSTENLKPDSWSVSQDLCGDCRKCLDACPTGALVAPFVLDARRCLNYWTIEFRGDSNEIPPEIRERLGDRFFGCDTCQDVCPWNRGDSAGLPPGTVDPTSLDAERLRDLAGGTPLARKFIGNG